MSSNDLLQNGASRRAFLTTGFGIAAASALSPFDALASRPGDIRRISIYNPRADEHLDAIYYVRGTYVSEVMQRVNNILRDVRSDTMIEMDRRLIDIMSATQYLLGHDRPFSVISGYRTRATNDALVRKGRTKARNSYHIKGMAADLRMEGVSVAEIVKAGKLLSSGGVGIYTKSNFVHLDSGPVRSWGA